jgi:hypothetical protein
MLSARPGPENTLVRGATTLKSRDNLSLSEGDGRQIEARDTEAGLASRSRERLPREVKVLTTRELLRAAWKSIFHYGDSVALRGEHRKWSTPTVKHQAARRDRKTPAGLLP